MTKRAQRTDHHRPGAIVPSDYDYLMSYALPDETPGSAYEVDRMRSICEEIGWGRDRPMFGNAGKCGICGANFRYGDLWNHAPSGALIHVGHDCADKYEMLADRPGFDAALETLKKGRAAYIAGQRRADVWALFLQRTTGLEEALATDHKITRAMADNGRRYGSLTDRQIALAFKIQDQVKNPPSPPAETPQGKHQGTEGKRSDFSVDLIRVSAYETTNFRTGEPDTGYIWVFRAHDGSDLVWFTGSPPCNKPGERDAGSGTVAGGPIAVVVKATVKSHTHREGRPQTILTRAAVKWPGEMAQSWDDKWARERAEREAQ